MIILVHGLLHLAGHDHHTAEARALMQAETERVVTALRVRGVISEEAQRVAKTYELEPAPTKEEYDRQAAAEEAEEAAAAAAAASARSAAGAAAGTPVAPTGGAASAAAEADDYLEVPLPAEGLLSFDDPEVEESSSDDDDLSDSDLSGSGGDDVAEVTRTALTGTPAAAVVAPAAAATATGTAAASAAPTDEPSYPKKTKKPGKGSFDDVLTSKEDMLRELRGDPSMADLVKAIESGEVQFGYSRTSGSTLLQGGKRGGIAPDAVPLVRSPTKSKQSVRPAAGAADSGDAFAAAPGKGSSG